jgi:G:T/U-mismatch repair DNA glycosylase
MTTELHPFEPFLPEGAKVLMLGSFPPQRKRWCMEFYYPNWLNDFWRICGIVFYGEREHFVIPGQKRFDLQKIMEFCNGKGIALYDTATEVRRLQDNASDKFLEIVTPTDLPALLARIPDCRAIVTTGQKATETIASAYGHGDASGMPPVGGCTGIVIGGRMLDFYRMPSTSRAYPLSLEKKADAYRLLFTAIGLV